VVYTRVSDPSQVEGHSLEAQERLFYELCKARGWEPVGVYREEGRSAHSEAIAKRPVFKKLLEDSGKGLFDVVVVHSIDRWSRNLRVTLDSLSILARNNVAIVSITENIDYTTPQGKLFIQMLGAFAEYFSGALAAHVSKGLDQRAFEGKHTGGIPFGYESCWIEENGERKRRCDPEHPGSVHIIEKEAQIVIELFRLYLTGTVTLSQLAVMVNERGFRTHNTHSLPDAKGNITAGPKLFTTASIRGILHNPFYCGKIKYRGKLMAGKHEALISEEDFEKVQIMLKRNSGRSETLAVKPQRQYLLKGIIRCVHCGLPMSSQTYYSGNAYYREQKSSRSSGLCTDGASINCQTIDEQMESLVSAIELGPRWLEEVLTIISLKDEVHRVKKARQDLEEKMRRMVKTYQDGLFPDEEYNRQKKLIEMELASLVVPAADASEEAGRLIMNLKSLWFEANLEEKRKLLLTMLDAVYVDARETKSIVAIRPKPPFKAIFQVAVAKKGSQIRIINEPIEGTSVFLVETGESPSIPR
jgi:DNA invertase Pin-like site-specific DNA recombinase